MERRERIRDGSPLLGRLADKTKTEWLLSFANAAFGDEPVGQIAAPAILEVLHSPSKLAGDTESSPPASIHDRKCVQIRDRHRPCRNRSDLLPAGRSGAGEIDAACSNY